MVGVLKGERFVDDEGADLVTSRVAQAAVRRRVGSIHVSPRGRSRSEPRFLTISRVPFTNLAAVKLAISAPISGRHALGQSPMLACSNVRRQGSTVNSE